jgi:predicted phage tail protein
MFNLTTSRLFDCTGSIRDRQRRRGGRLDDAGSTADATGVKGTLLATAALVLGAMIVAVKLATDGPTPSFMLGVGVLLIADGVLRLLTRGQDRAS